MFCTHCGAELSKEAKFCSNCGRSVSIQIKKEVPPEREANQPTTATNEKSGWTFFSLFNWSISSKELENQTRNYESLSWKHSFRRVSGLLLLFSAAITLLLMLMGLWSDDALIDLIILVVLALFVWKGSFVAIILAMIYWTADRLYLLATGQGVGMQILWWLIYMGVFWKAFQVEQYRRRTKKELETSGK